MKVLVADDDPCGIEVLAAVLRAAGHQCVLARGGDEAWDILQSPAPPQIAFLDWMMPGVDGLEVCRRIRERGGSEYTYVTIVSARNKQQDIIDGFHSGADDFITKPYKPEDILTRVRVAERLLRSFTANSSLSRALAEAREGASGDVIVRTLRRVGRILFHEGRIAWAHVSDEPGSLAAILAGEPDISRDDVRAVLAECGSTGQNFADVLVAWNLLTPGRLRALLRDWIRSKIATIAAFPLPVVLFSPESRVATGGLLFDPAEVLPAEIEAVLGGDGPEAANAPPGRRRAPRRPARGRPAERVRARGPPRARARHRGRQRGRRLRPQERPLPRRARGRHGPRSRVEPAPPGLPEQPLG